MGNGNLEKMVNGLFVERFSKEDRLKNKGLIIEYMTQSSHNADQVAEIVIKLLGSARSCLSEFSDLGLADLLFLLREVDYINFSSKTRKGIRTVKSWSEWRQLPNDFRGVKIYTEN